MEIQLCSHCIVLHCGFVYISDSCRGNLGFLDFAGNGLGGVKGGLSVNSKFGDDEQDNCVCIAVVFLRCSLFLHLRLIKQRPSVLGLCGKWFGWFNVGLSANSKFGDNGNTVSVALQFVCLHCIIFLNLCLLKLRPGFLGLRGK